VIVVNPTRPAERARRRPAARGATVLVKDNVETREVADHGWQPGAAGNATGRDAPLIARHARGGGWCSARPTLSEWANIRSSRSSSGWSAVGGLTRNPHGDGRNACGSSSGSGAAIAAGLAWAAIGTETDGSITCPASVNGIVGFKPTVGLVSRRTSCPSATARTPPGR
jgi:amidase